MNLPIDNFGKTISLRGALPVALVFSIAMIFYGSLICFRPIYTKGEGREAVVVQAMLEQVNFVLPLRNGLAIPSKPPLFHWLAVLASIICGSLNSFSVRLPSVFSAAFTLSISLLCIRNYLSKTQTWLSVLILASSFEFVRNGSHARVDMCFTAAFSSAAYLLFLNTQLWFRQHRYRWSYLLTTAIAVAASVLAKGPAALFLFGFIGICFFALLARKNIARAASQLPWIPLLLASVFCLLIFGSWYWLAYIQENTAFLAKHILAENIARVLPVPGTDPGHQKPFYFVLVDLFTGLLPWSIFLPASAAYVWSQRFSLLKETHRLQLFALVWLATFLLAAACSISKRPVYLLPAYPAAAILLATSLDTQSMQTKVWRYSTRFASLILFFFSAILVIVSILTLLAGLQNDWFSRALISHGPIGLSEELPRMLRGLAGYLTQHSTFYIAVIFFLNVAGFSARMLWRGDRLGYHGLGLSAALCMFITTVWLVNWDAHRKDPRNFIAASTRLLPEGVPLYAYQVSTYPLRFYFGRDITEVNSMNEFVNSSFSYAIVSTNALPEIQNQNIDYKILFQGKEHTERGSDHLLLLAKIQNNNQSDR